MENKKKDCRKRKRGSTGDDSDRGVDEYQVDVLELDGIDEDIPFHTPYLPKPPFRMAINAQSNSGKTNFLMNLLFKPHWYGDVFGDRVYIQSNSLTTDSAHWNIAPDAILRKAKSEYDEEAIVKLLEEAVADVEKNGKNKKNQRLLVLDDVIENIQKVGGGKLSFLEVMIMRCRHANISMIIISQKYKLIPTTIRINADFWVFFAIYNSRELANIWEEHGGHMTKKEFIKMASLVWAKKYRFLTINYKKSGLERFSQNLTEVPEGLPPLSADDDKIGGRDEEFGFGEVEVKDTSGDKLSEANVNINVKKLLRDDTQLSQLREILDENQDVDEMKVNYLDEKFEDRMDRLGVERKGFLETFDDEVNELGGINSSISNFYQF